MTTAEPLSNLQQELLKVYSSNVSEEDLLYIKRFLANYFAKKPSRKLTLYGMKKDIQTKR